MALGTRAELFWELRLPPTILCFGGEGKKRDVREQSSGCEGWLWDSAEEVGGAGWVVEHSGPGSSWSMEAGVVVEPTVGERASS